jgi:hypothetical protein
LAYGVKGWNRYKPTSREGSLGQAIVELKDFRHMMAQSSSAALMQTRLRQLPMDSVSHHAGSHYLNIQFGWAPFLKDVRDLVKNAIESQKRLNQLARDNGKWVRRGGTIDQQHSTTSAISTGNFSSPSLPSVLNPAGNETQFRTTSHMTYIGSVVVFGTIYPRWPLGHSGSI